MGPSGAGKSSLLDILAGRKRVGTITGTVRINGTAMTPAALRAVSGYVTQDDAALPAMLTVRECIYFHARLRLGPDAANDSSESPNAMLGGHNDCVPTAVYRG